MTDSMLPILRQMHDAADDRARAALLLQVSDAVLMKYRDAFEAACRRAGFEGGLAWIDIRRTAYLAVRGPDGRLTNPLFEQARKDFAAFAGISDSPDVSAVIDRFNSLIDDIEGRCLAVDGPVTPTLSEMREAELAEIWSCLREIRRTTGEARKADLPSDVVVRPSAASGEAASSEGQDK